MNDGSCCAPDAPFGAAVLARVPLAFALRRQRCRLAATHRGRELNAGLRRRPLPTRHRRVRTWGHDKPADGGSCEPRATPKPALLRRRRDSHRCRSSRLPRWPEPAGGCHGQPPCPVFCAFCFTLEFPPSRPPGCPARRLRDDHEGSDQIPAARAALREGRLAPRPAGPLSGRCLRLLFKRGVIFQGNRNAVQIIRKENMGTFGAGVSNLFPKSELVCAVHGLHGRIAFHLHAI